jgi:heme o synthase
MKAIHPPWNVALPARTSWLAVWAELVKARLTSLVLLSTAAGFYLGAPGDIDGSLLIHTILGTGLLAGGASALNQLMERDQDARMVRTQDRPLPSGRLQPQTALVFGLFSCVTGTLYLWVMANLLTGVLGALTAVIYLGLYTPLKTRTWLNTLVGAIPGGLPPLIGWAASRGELSWEGWVLFALQLFWQVPHFLSIAWIYRDDYARAGFLMLPVLDRTGRTTGPLVMLCCAGALVASLVPAAAGVVGHGYLVGAVSLGAILGWAGVQFCRRFTAESARRLFLTSILYLTLLFVLLVCCKTPTGPGMP